MSDVSLRTIRITIILSWIGVIFILWLACIKNDSVLYFGSGVLTYHLVRHITPYAFESPKKSPVSITDAVGDEKKEATA